MIENYTPNWPDQVTTRILERHFNQIELFFAEFMADARKFISGARTFNPESEDTQLQFKQRVECMNMSFDTLADAFPELFDAYAKAIGIALNDEESEEEDS